VVQAYTVSLRTIEDLMSRLQAVVTEVESNRKENVNAWHYDWN